MVNVSLDSPSCEVTLFDPVYRWFIGTLPDRPRDYTVWSTLEPSEVDSRTWAGIIQVGSATLTETSSHDNIQFVLSHPRNSFGLAKSSLHDNYFRNNACAGLRCHSLWANRDIFHGNICLILARPRNWSRSSAGPRRHLLWANRDIFVWHHTTCLGPPKELIIPCEGPRHQFLRANCDISASQHVNSHGPPKESIEATSKIYFSLANWLPLIFTYFQYNSVYWFTTLSTYKFTEGASLPYFQ
jgi:hypothetical protein